MHLSRMAVHSTMRERCMLAAMRQAHKGARPNLTGSNTMNNTPATTRHLTAVPALAKPERCEKHRAYDADYCPVCGTARVIGGNR